MNLEEKGLLSASALGELLAGTSCMLPLMNAPGLAAGALLENALCVAVGMLLGKILGKPLIGYAGLMPVNAHGLDAAPLLENDLCVAVGMLLAKTL
jgi:hypothetical protein